MSFVHGPDLLLTRFCDSDFGTFGEMLVDGQRLFTVERPWLGNQRSVSCIPAGVYECRPRRFNRGGYDAVEVRNVPRRSRILFHRANVSTDVQGCIGVGARLSCLGGAWAVLDSRNAFELFMAHFNREFLLEIHNGPDHWREAMAPVQASEAMEAMAQPQAGAAGQDTTGH